MPAQNSVAYLLSYTYELFEPGADRVGDLYFGVDVELNIFVVVLGLEEPRLELDDFALPLLNVGECLFVSVVQE